MREENRRTGRKTLEARRNQPQTQPTYGTEPELNPGHIGGRQAILTLCHPCYPSKSEYSKGN